jgi:hypothetical protein
MTAMEMLLVSVDQGKLRCNLQVKLRVRAWNDGNIGIVSCGTYPHRPIQQADMLSPICTVNVTVSSLEKQAPGSCQSLVEASVQQRRTVNRSWDRVYPLKEDI